MSLRDQITRFLNDPEQNVLSFELAELKSDKIRFTMLDDLYEFTIHLNNDRSMNVSTTSPALQGVWTQHVNRCCNEKKHMIQIGELLDECIIAYSLLDDDGTEEHHSVEDHSIASADDATPMQDDGGYDPFDTALLSPSAQAKKDQQLKVLAEHQQKQLQKTIHNLHVGNLISNMKASEIKAENRKKTADKDMLCTFYTDGFTIDNGPLRSLTDPRNKALLESLQKGFVPVEFSENAREIDLHVVWEDCTFAEKKKQQEQIKQSEEDELEEEYLQSQLAQIISSQHSAHDHSTMDQSQDKPQSTTQASPKSSVQPSPPKPTTAPQRGIFEKKSNNNYQPSLNESLDMTTIQFRVNSERITQKFNLDMKIEEMVKFLANNERMPFSLFSLALSFPRKVLDDVSQTLRDANLKNAAIMVENKG